MKGLLNFEKQSLLLIFLIMQNSDRRNHVKIENFSSKSVVGTTHFVVITAVSVDATSRVQLFGSSI